MMKRNLILWAACSTLVLSGCDTYAGSGAYAGSGIGAILGSAIGGLTGGPRGSDAGTIIGMAGGAVIGGAIGSQADERRQIENDQYRRERIARMQAREHSNDTSSDVDSQQQDSNQVSGDDSGFDSSNSGDDRIYDFNGSDYNGNYSARQPISMQPSHSSAGSVFGSYAYAPYLEIRNARFVDDNQDNAMSRNEVCKVIFEIYNTSHQTVTDIVPTVIETNHNRHIYISPSIHIERIAPGQGIRYTAVVKADGKLRNGYAKFCVSVLQNDCVLSKVSEFNIPTRGISIH